MSDVPELGRPHGGVNAEVTERIEELVAQAPRLNSDQLDRLRRMFERESHPDLPAA